MIAKTFTGQPSPQEGAVEAGTQAHCRRVAAWCDELARKLRLPVHEARALVEAAEQHHQPKPLGASSLCRLMGDLGLPASENGYEDAGPGKSRLTDRILNVFNSQRPEPQGDRISELARMLEAANCFDEQLEYAPFEHDGIEKVLNKAVDQRRQIEEAVGFVLQNLRRASRDDLTVILPKLPVYPAIAMRLYRLLAGNDVSLSALESIANTDQVVAGKLLKAANSVFYSPWQPIKSVAQAISYVGTRDARRILLASSIQPLFATPRLRKLWKHALEAAQVAERIAALSGKVDPGEAFLMGLLHDVGKLAVSMLSKEINEAVDRLIEKGCQPAVAELVLCGFDHAEAGAEVMRHWKFSEEVVQAVQYHHQPERTGSAMAAVLYLTEFWTDSEEDIPSNARLHTAMNLASLTPESLDASRVQFNNAMLSL
jgi:putative nucleotidyltransferase with HDIG domain